VPVAGVFLAVTAGAGQEVPPDRPVLLVLRALGLGDLLTALPAFRALVDAFPQHRRVLAMPRALEPLATAASVVDEVLYTADLEAAAARLDPGAAVDVAVNLHGRGPESSRALVRLQPRRLVAFAHPDVPETADGPAWLPDEHEVARWCRLLSENGIPAHPDRLDLALPPGLAATPPAVPGATVVHPGAASAARRWPPERWAAVAASERRAGRTVLVTGAPSEVELARAVADSAGLPPDAVVAGTTTVLELSAVVAAAEVVLCGDTGVAHLATALGTPSVVLFGPTPPSQWGPPPGRAIHRILWSGLTGDPHGDQPHPGLLAITVDDVVRELAALRRNAALVR
jgi:ADP-heptose:LPS heptosyltransferase